MICVSIAEADFSVCLKRIKQYDFIELRLDAASFSVPQIKQLVSAAHKIVVTFRPGNPDVQFRLDSLIAAISAGADMVDMEIDSPEGFRNELIKQAKSKKCRIILSYHDYKSTPSEDLLKNLMSECYSKGADIAKIACQVNAADDNARLLSLYALPGRKVIIGMGELGRITRLAALYLGAAFSYVSPENGNSTAAGQLSYKEFQTIQNLLNNKSR